MEDIFISHSSLDRNVAESVCDILESSGFSCWISFRIKDLQPGKIYTEAINEAIDNSKIFLVLLSNNSISSEQVRQEVICANERQRYGTKIFPVIIDENVDMNAIHKHMGYVLAGKESVNWYDQSSQEELLNQIAIILNIPSTTEVCEIVSNTIECGSVVGRENEIISIKQKLRERKKLCLNGIGGIGKTALIQAYCQNEGKKIYSNIIYMSVEKCILRTIANDKSLILKSDLLETKKKSLSDYEYAFYKLSLLENSVDESTLLILDNVESSNDPLLERICNLKCNIIIVARHLEFGKYGFETYNLNSISEKSKVVELFELHYKNKLDIEEQNALFKLLNDISFHTMSVILLAKQMNYFGKKPSNYKSINQIRLERSSGLNQMLSSEAYGSDIAQIYNQLFDLFNVRSFSIDDKKILKTLSLIPGEGVYRHLYLKLVGEEYVSTLNKLEQTGWVQNDKSKSTIILHPLVRDVIVHELDIYIEDPDIQNFTDNFIKSISNAYDRTYQENVKYKELALSIYFQFAQPTVANYKNYLVLSNFLWVLNCMDISLEIQNKVKMLFVDAKGTSSNTAEEAEAFMQIGFTYQVKGDYNAAEKELEQATKIYGNKFAASLSHLAQAKMSTGENKLEEVEPLLKQSLKIREQYWPGTISEAVSCHLYAKTLSSYGVNLDYAITLEKRAYKLFSKLQPGGVTVSSAAYILGWLYVQTAEDLDDIEYGIANLEEAKTIRLEYRGDPLHPWMDDIYLKLGLAYEKYNDYNRAKDYYEMLLKVRCNKYNNNQTHKEIIAVYKSLQNVYASLGDVEGEKKCRKHIRYYS